MDFFTVILVVLIMISATVFVFVRHFRLHEEPDRKARLAPFLMLAAVLVVISDQIAGGDGLARLPLNLIFSLSPMLVVTSSLWECEDIFKGLVGILSVQALVLAYNIMASIGVFPLLAVKWTMRLSGIGAVFISLMFLHAVHQRVRQVKLVMKHGNVWSCLNVMVDMVYILFIQVYSFVVVLSIGECDMSARFPVHLASVMLALEFAALGFRVANDSAFVICARHERRIVESMKLSNIEAALNSSKGEEMYKQIYEKVVELFERDRIYLNSELTINDIVKVVYTNKLYISRAISQYTGRNFCQFVNYYRVIHAVGLFRQNPDLKVTELANRSGFNSSVSFSMAFRLYMSENPSDWCRKEKYKLKGKKK